MDRNRIFNPFARVAAGVIVSILAVNGAGAAGAHSTSGNVRPLMPGNQPAGTSLQQKTPGAATAKPGAAKPFSPREPPPTGVTSPSSGNASSGPLSGQGTVQGSKGAPQPGGPGLPGGTAGSRGAKDSIGGR